MRVLSTEIGKFLNSDVSTEFELTGPSSLNRLKPNTLAFINEWGWEREEVVAANSKTLFLVPMDAPVAKNLIRIEDPRHTFALVLNRFFRSEPEPTVAPSAVIDPSANCPQSVRIGHGVILEAGVVLGEHVVIGPYTVLQRGVRVGDDCRIGSHCSIGGPGYGYSSGPDGIPIHIPHFGSVHLGDRVEIGNHVSIARGTIDDTVIASDVKIDDCVFIAHNVQVDEGAMIIAGAEISGSVKIGKRVWVAPEVAIRNQITVGDDAILGMGSVVTRDVPAGVTVTGVPARVIPGSGSSRGRK